MERPKCRICGVRHFLSEPHDLPDDPKPVRAELARRKPVKAELPVVIVTDRGRKWREKNREAYNAYQKELMRKRRGRDG